MRPVEAWQVHLRVAGTAEGGRRAVALALALVLVFA